MIGQQLGEIEETVSGVIAISRNEPLATFTITIKGFETVNLSIPNLYGVQEQFLILWVALEW